MIKTSVLFVLVFLIAPNMAWPQTREKVRVALGSISVNTSVIPVGHQYGLYAKYGVDLEPIYMGGGMNSLAAVTSNSVQFLSAGSTATISARLGGMEITMLTVQSSKLEYSIFAAPVALPQVMLANLNGADLVNVAHTIAAVNSKLLVKPEIKRPEDLRGKKIATSSIGSLGDFLFCYILRKHGLDPKREITWLSIVTRRKTIQDDRDTVMRVVRSHVEGIAFLKQNKEFSMKVLTKYVKTTDPEFLEGSYAIFRQDFIAAPYPITKGLEATYDYVAQTRPDIRNRRPEEFVVASFITELDKSGFIRKLYEGSRQ